ncbi:hypothetical protein F8M41_017230 [Gigaspora margarita]|uniref:Uncharacterized protein n=1 Tax=Gigaspora margarita TaxID=4874 RepID=A0A8H4EM46_GIGMA|nr:hypothetical protein F8M41_017230 [Gigaspora margarita]
MPLKSIDKLHQLRELKIITLQQSNQSKRPTETDPTSVGLWTKSPLYWTYKLDYWTYRSSRPFISPVLVQFYWTYK